MNATREDWIERLLGAADELTKPRTTVELIPEWSAARNRKYRQHRVEHDPLLVELACAVVPGNGSQDVVGARSVPGSRPAARLDAIDHMEAIQAGVLLWLARLDLDRRTYLVDNVHALVGATGRMGDDVLTWLARDAQQWVTWAQVVTGWATPSFAPHVACPSCDRIGGLRIRIEKVACCLICGADWREEDGGIYVLADHVRLMSGEEESA